MLQVSKTLSIVQCSTDKCFFPCSSHIHTLCNQLKKISFCSCTVYVMVWCGILKIYWSFWSGYKHDKDIEESYKFYSFVYFIGGTNSMGNSKLK